MKGRLEIQISLVAVLVAGGECLAQTAPTNAALMDHLSDLAKKVPKGFTVVVQSPFVVLGDESPELVKRRSTQTVRWAVDKLKQDYFQRDPREIIDIWLFRDGVSYTNYARLLFHETPTSRFGYYSEAHRALIMNIETGRGTLVHEIVHPFIRADFPNCPAWFNEGLASLFEASTEKNEERPYPGANQLALQGIGAGHQTRKDDFISTAHGDDG